MRPRILKKIVDARRHQKRVILQLDCGHNRTVWCDDSLRDPEFIVNPWEIQVGSAVCCYDCPDVPPKPNDESTQLYYEVYGDKTIKQGGNV